MSAAHRVGMIVPSSNTTMETELPAMARRVPDAEFTFHASRAVLHQVDEASLDRMVGQADRCVAELTDARVDVIAYACLVAVMARGPRAHEAIERQLVEHARRAGYEPAITSSAGALIRATQALGIERVAIIAPYAPELTAKVVAYIEDYGIEVVDAHSRQVVDNVQVGRLDPLGLPEIAGGLELSRAQGLIVSACVQMPSLPAVPVVEQRYGLPVLSAATATMWEVLSHLRIDPVVAGAGALLSGEAPRSVAQ